MRLITLSWVVFVLIFTSSAYKINKCCPEGQMYGVVEDQPVCVPANTTKYNWLPKSVNETIINSLNISFSDAQCSINFAEWSFGFDLKRPNDSLKFVNDSLFFVENDETFRDSSFCLDNLQVRTFVIKVARKCPCLEKICILKCCGEKQILNKSNHCVNAVNATNWQLKMSKATIAGKFKTLYQFPDCASMNKTLMYVNKYKLNKNGSISLNGNTAMDPDEYCGDYKRDNGGRVDTIIACFTINELIITTESKINGAMSVVGAFFFLVTSIILFWIPELGGSPKWSMVIHVSGFFVANASLAYQKFSPKLSGDISCKIIAFVMQFSLMASFFWLNVMCIDLTLTFGSMKSMVFKKYTERRNFIIYSLYAWGGSLLITLATVIAEFTSTIHEYSPLKPNFGQNKCWFAETEALWIFFIGPIGLLLCFNLGLLMYASFQIIKIKRETKALKNDDSNIRYRKKHVKRFSLYLRIFMLMGIPWLTEIVSWAITNEEIEWHYYWYIIDFVNIVKAVSIFVIFCCKEKVWVEAKKVAPCLRHCEKLIFSCLCKKGSAGIDIIRNDSIFTIAGLSESVTDVDINCINMTSGQNGGSQSGCNRAFVSVYARVKMIMETLNINYFHLIFGVCLSFVVVIIIRYLFDVSSDFPIENHVFNVSRFLENFDTNLIDK